MSNQTPLLEEHKDPNLEQGVTRIQDPQEAGPIDQVPVGNQRAQDPEREDIPIIVIEEEYPREEHEHKKFSLTETLSSIFNIIIALLFFIPWIFFYIIRRRRSWPEIDENSQKVSYISKIKELKGTKDRVLCISLNLSLYVGIWSKFALIKISKEWNRMFSLVAQVLGAAILLFFIFFKYKPFLNHLRPKQPTSADVENLMFSQRKSWFLAGNEEEALKAQLERKNWIQELSFPKRWLYLSAILQIVVSYFVDFWIFGPWVGDCDRWGWETLGSIFLQFPFIYLSTLALSKHNFIVSYRRALYKKVGRFSKVKNSDLFDNQNELKSKLETWCDLARLCINFGSDDLSNADNQILTVMVYFLLRFVLVWIEKLFSDPHEKGNCEDTVLHFYVFYGVIILIQIVHVLYSLGAERKIKKLAEDQLRDLTNYELYYKRLKNKAKRSKNRDLETLGEHHETIKKQLKQCILEVPILCTRKMIGGLFAMSVVVLPFIEKLPEEHSDSTSYVMIIFATLYLVFLFLFKFYKKGLE